MSRLKPIPKNAEEISQEQITPYLSNIGLPVSKTVFSENRGTDYSMKNDTVKDISIGLEDIDEAIMFYFNNIIKPSVIQNGQQIAVPVIYGSPERWKSVQADGYYRDNSGRMMAPLIMFKRDSIEKNRSLGNKLDGNTVHLHQIVGTKYNIKNAYDKFDIINNRIPSEQYYITTTPDYITLTYNCIIFTDFVEQNNKLVEAINFASDSYWGDPNRFKFRASIDSFTTTTLLEAGTDRAAKSTFTIKVNGYIIPDTVNKDMATARSKFYTTSQIVFSIDTVSSINNNTQTPLKTQMGSTSFLDSFPTTNNTITDSIDSMTLTYLNTNKAVLATTVTTSTATFSNGFLTAPSGLPTTSVNNFTFFVNGQLIEPNAIVSFIDNGDNTSTLTVNSTTLGFSLGTTWELVAIGKFA
jgi:hypothetical protein